MNWELTGDYALYASIAVFLTPYVVALFKNLGKWQWPTWLVKLLALLISLVAGAVAWAAAEGLDSLTVSALIANGVVIWGLSQVVYAKLIPEDGFGSTNALANFGDTTPGS
jgi:hypothetical protein